MSAKIYNFDDYKRKRILEAAAKLEARAAYLRANKRGTPRTDEQVTLACTGYQDALRQWQDNHMDGSDCGCSNGQSRWFQ